MSSSVNDRTLEGPRMQEINDLISSLIQHRTRRRENGRRPYRERDYSIYI